jgi:signal transduction histidine kinase
MLNINGDNDIHMFSYPSPISQIFTNLVNNSLKYGFENRPSGSIFISVNKKDEQVIIIYTDNGNGNGINEKILDKIYKPFITTKRNNGGSGLGIHIVLNLITQLF